MELLIIVIKILYSNYGYSYVDQRSQKGVNENLRIYGYIQSNKGIILNYEYININIQLILKKFTDNDLKIILNYKESINSKTIKKNRIF